MASLQVSGPKLSDTITPISSCPWRYLPRETIQELWYYVCPGDMWRSWYSPVILLNPVISLYSFMENFTALEMTVFFLKISSDGQSFHFMVYERSGILGKRSSSKNIEKNSLSPNECRFVHSHFLVNFFLTYPVWDCLWEKGKGNLDIWLTLFKNNRNFKYKMQKNDLLIAKVLKMLRLGV